MREPTKRDQTPAAVLPEALSRATARAPGPRGISPPFDNAFPVHLSSVRGESSGVGRNITPEGMFIETREPCPLGTELRIEFDAGALGSQVIAVAEVRFQAFLNFAGDAGSTNGLRGVGVRFVRFESGPVPSRELAH